MALTEPLKIIGVLAGSLILVLLLSPVGSWLARRKLERWAEAQRLRLSKRAISRSRTRPLPHGLSHSHADSK